MIFWTDNYSEPKKVNIPRSKQGTLNLLTQTLLVNESQHPNTTSFNTPGSEEEIKEKHITVIKKAPRKPLDMVVKSSRTPLKTYTGVITIANDLGSGVNQSSFTTPNMYNFSGITTEDGSNIFDVEIEHGLINGASSPIGPINDWNGLTGWHKDPNYSGFGYGSLNNIKLGTKIVFKPFDEDGTPPGIPVTDYVIKGVIEDYVPSNQYQNTGSTIIKVKVIAIDGFPPIAPDNGTLDYVVDLWDESEKLFEIL